MENTQETKELKGIFKFSVEGKKITFLNLSTLFLKHSKKESRWKLNTCGIFFPSNKFCTRQIIQDVNVFRILY